jgi:hypothetical protein
MFRVFGATGRVVIPSAITGPCSLVPARCFSLPTLAASRLHQHPPPRCFSVMSTPPVAKKMKSTKVSSLSSLMTSRHTLLTCLKVIGTHSGTFHCDGMFIFFQPGLWLLLRSCFADISPEALAVFLLRLTDEFKDAGKLLHWPASLQHRF